MNLRYSPEVDDWLDALRATPGSFWNVIQFLLTFVPIFVLGYILGTEGFVLVAWICVASSIAIAFAGYEVPRMLLRRQFNAAPTAKGERLLTINNENMVSSLPSVEARYRWDAFTHYRETKGVFVLFVSPRQVGFWIPKRVMSREQIQELRHLCETKFSKK